MSKAETDGDENLPKDMATTPPVKQMDNLGAAVETAEKKERVPTHPGGRGKGEAGDGTSDDGTA